MNFQSRAVTAKEVEEAVKTVKESGGYILAVYPTKFKASGKEKDTLTATHFVVLSK